MSGRGLASMAEVAQGGNYTSFLLTSNQSEYHLDVGHNGLNDTNLFKSLGFGFSDDSETRKVIHLSTAIFLALVGFLGTLGNGLVLYAFTR